jgi:uncharacterized protein
MSETTNKIALVTGAGSGVGYELAKCFAEDGCHLVLVGSREADLQEIATDFRAHYGVRVEVIAKDLSQPKAPHDLYGELRAKGIIVSYLVNDAGQGVYGNFAETDLDKELAIIQSNIGSTVVLTKLFLRDMLARNQGRILNVASAVRTTPVPFSAVYSATKGFVYDLTHALVAELEGTKVTVTALRTSQEGELARPETVARDGYQAMLQGNDSVAAGVPAKQSATGEAWRRPA